MHPVFFLTFGYFLVGGVAIGLIHRRSAEAERSERWKKYAVYFLIVHVVIVAILAGVWYFVCLAAAVVAVGLYELLRATAGGAGWRLKTLAGALPLYAALGLAFIQFARMSRTEMILFVWVVVFTFDGFSQIGGQLLGSHTLAPRVSPGKTVEGLGSGLAMAVATALPLSAWTGIGRPLAVGLALLVAVSALLGDLAASYVKRACKLKDYATWIPGHGGILDRFDSFIAAGSVYWSVVGR
jgi:phosphatidate cytidylyltransferase